MEVPIHFDYLPYQEQVFNDPARFKVITKGRRVGFTHGVAKYCIEVLLDHATEDRFHLLWVDTIYGNIRRYYERYFLPQLQQLPRTLWEWNGIQKELRIGNATLDFRSADRPESLEGFSYHGSILNEAGIILQNPYLWENAILPMLLDFSGWCIIGGTPKGKTSRRTQKEHLFYTLAKRGMKNAPAIFRNWKTFRIPTNANPLIDPKDIEELESSIPHAVREQEIRGFYIDATAEGVFKKAWFQYFTTAQIPAVNLMVIQSWDTACGDGEENDYSVGITAILTPSHFLIVDCVKGQWNYPELKKEFENFASKHNPDIILLEKKASGISLLQDLQSSTRLPIRPIVPDKDKVTRSQTASPSVETGRVLVLDGQEWTLDFVNDLCGFPDYGRDTADAFSQLINEFKDRHLETEAEALSTRSNKRSSRTAEGF
jgi:predicted phage terminase large subunit-like protein